MLKYTATLFGSYNPKPVLQIWISLSSDETWVTHKFPCPRATSPANRTRNQTSKFPQGLIFNPNPSSIPSYWTKQLYYLTSPVRSGQFCFIRRLDHTNTAKKLYTMIECWTCLLQVFPSEKHTISSDSHKLVATTKRLGASGFFASGTETSDDGKRGQITEELKAIISDFLFTPN